MLFFDANLAGPLSCRRRCRRDTRHFCIHRFGPRMRAMMLPSDKMRLSDLGVVRYLFGEIGRGVPGVKGRDINWLLITRDKGFWKSARHSYKSSNRRERRHHPKLFFITNGRRQYILSAVGYQIVCIEVLRQSSNKHKGGTLWDLEQTFQAVQLWAA